MLVTRARVAGLIAIVLIGTVALPLHAASAQANAAVAESTDDATIRSLWAKLDAAWSTRDAEQFSRLFTEDASFGFVGRGQALESRAIIRQHFTQQFSRQAPELRHLTQVREIRLVAPGVVTVDGNVDVLRKASGESAESTVLRTFAIFAVMLKSDDGWEIRVLRAYQLPSATAAAGDS